MSYSPDMPWYAWLGIGYGVFCLLLVAYCAGVYFGTPAQHWPNRWPRDDS